MKVFKYIVVFIACFWINPQVFLQGASEKYTFSNRQKVIDSVICIGEKYLGKPYRYKAPNINMLDCSGFINEIFKPFEPGLSRSSAMIAKQVEKVSLKDAQAGDLMFFKGRNINSPHVGHVSMIVENLGDGKIKMMHSCNRGVIIEEYPNKYYQPRFLFAGRIPSLDTIQINLNTTETEDSLALEQASENERTLKIIGVGDLMLGTNFPSNKYLPPNDGKDLLLPIHSITAQADLTVGNLEGVLLTGDGELKRCKDSSVCYAFKSPDHYVNHFVNAGFDVLGLANNHIGDFGNTGRKNTVRLLEENNIHFAGLEDFPYTTFEKDGIRYGFCAFAPNTGTIKINDYARAQQIIQHLDSISDIVIVSFHGGAEGAKYNRVTRETEMFLGENRGNPYEFARMAIDAGADIVFGHGPHVVRAVDLYKDRFIAYSLGNFATYARFNLKGPNGLAPLVEVEVDKTGKFLGAKVYSFEQLGQGGPTIDEANRAFKEMKRLTELDIPEVKLFFTENNEIFPVQD